MNKHYALLILGLLVLAGCAATDNLEEPQTPPQETPPTQQAGASTQAPAQNGDLVVVQYVGTLADGTVFDASQEEPLEFVLGQGMLIPGFEEAITGMQAGEEKTFTLSAEEAYGPRTDETQEIPLEEFGEQAPEEGMMINIIDPETQQQQPATVIEVGAETATLDLNHPLAGEELTFEVEVVDVQEAPDQGLPPGMQIQ